MNKIGIILYNLYNFFENLWNISRKKSTNTRLSSDNCRHYAVRLWDICRHGDTHMMTSWHAKAFCFTDNLWENSIGTFLGFITMTSDGTTISMSSVKCMVLGAPHLEHLWTNISFKVDNGMHQLLLISVSSSSFQAHYVAKFNNPTIQKSIWVKCT